MNNGEPRSHIHFGAFELDLSSRELRKHGRKIRLHGQPFEILAMLLEHPGESVTREQIRTRLWPHDTFVDFEHSVNSAIKRLRQALGDSPLHPRFIETLPRLGYRFIGPLVPSAGPSAPAAASDVAVTAEEQQKEQRRPKPRNPWSAAFAIVVCCVLGTASYYWLRPPLSPPRVLDYRQLTSDRQIKDSVCSFKTNLVTDGPRVLFAELHSPLLQVASTGGDSINVVAPFSCFRVFDISPDKTELMGVYQPSGFEHDQPIWILSLANGLARRLANLSGFTGTWSPDGQRIAYANGNDLCFAAKDGSQMGKLVHTDGRIERMRWSPDGKVLRMTVVSGQGLGTIWEVSADGSNLRPYLPAQGRGHSFGAGSWTPDGKYFVFTVRTPPNVETTVWAVRERPSFFHKAIGPTQLASGPVCFWNAVPSADGRQIFAIGGQYRGELNRFDLKSGRLEPFLSGISAEHADFSKDGKWVTYVTFPEGTLWRSQSDGSQRMQLVGPPLRATLPRWSPDARRIAFTGILPGGYWQIYVISAEGGELRVVAPSEHDQMDATWSPDGDSLTFGGPGVGVGYITPSNLSSVNLRSAQVTVIPGSDGKFSPRDSPDGRFVVAVETPSLRRLSLFDRKTQSWSALVEMDRVGVYPHWSRNSEYVYFADPRDASAPILYRVRTANRKVERVAVLKAPGGATWGIFGPWIGWMPDGSALVLRNLQIQEIYALDVDLP